MVVPVEGDDRQQPEGAEQKFTMRPKKAARQKKMQLAALLVERGLFENLDEAKRWVMAGKVLVNEQRLDKPGMQVASNAALRVLDRTRYASRGGYKLEAALTHFQVTVTNKIALDSGASTGGFTDCLLQHGAAGVYAVEVGYGQLLGRLRLHPHVCNMERVNLGELTPAMLDPLPALITLDLSYLSLTEALPIAASLLAPQGQVLALIKPLFEVESVEARRSGNIDDPSLLVEAFEHIIQAGYSSGLYVQGIIKLALKPRHGVHEYMIALSNDEQAPTQTYDTQALLTLINGPGVGRSDDDDNGE